eukprot:14938721-Alexandrium_andersonii.AAC.1
MTGLGCPWQSHGMPRALGALCRFTGCADRALAAPHFAARGAAPGWGPRRRPAPLRGPRPSLRLVFPPGVQ